MTWRTVRPLWHVYPTDDLREHVTEGAGCWCKPTPDNEEPQLLVHHAMDGREAFETGELAGRAGIQVRHGAPHHADRHARGVIVSAKRHRTS